jgi:hypothetical protein
MLPATLNVGRLIKMFNAATQFEARLAELQSAHNQIMTTLRVMRWSGASKERDKQLDDALAESERLARDIAKQANGS